VSAHLISSGIAEADLRRNVNLLHQTAVLTHDRNPGLATTPYHQALGMLGLVVVATILGLSAYFVVIYLL